MLAQTSHLVSLYEMAKILYELCAAEIFAGLFHVCTYYGGEF